MMAKQGIGNVCRRPYVSKFCQRMPGLGMPIDDYHAPARLHEATHLTDRRFVLAQAPESMHEECHV